MHICFVCTGNICRSPMAELVFKEQARRAGMGDRVRTSSAGIEGWHVGKPADPRTVKVLVADGYPSAHVAARVSEEQLRADVLVAMDSGHGDALVTMVDDATRVRLLRSFDPAARQLDVPDPYHGADGGFVEVLGMVKAAMPGLLTWTRSQLALQGGAL